MYSLRLKKIGGNKKAGRLTTGIIKKNENELLK